MVKSFSKQEILVILTGIIGACINLYGQTLSSPPQPYYVAGSSLLLLVAMYFRFFYFVGLEFILLAGHFALMLDLNYRIQIAMPLLLCLQLLIYYLLVGKLKNFWIWIGLTGIAFLSVGFTYHEQWVFLIGGICVSIYSFYRIPGTRGISIIWAIMNSIFSIVVFIRFYL